MPSQSDKLDEREDRDEADDAPALPKGQKNYVTPRGLRLLQDELDQLRRVERPKVVEVVSWAAGNGDRSENGDYIYGKKRLREIDRRLRFLLKRIENAEVVDPARQQNLDRVFFGAKVTYLEEGEDGEDIEQRLRIVGIDEANSSQGEVSWVSPIARAMMKAQIGDEVVLRSPKGDRFLEITEISYDQSEET